VVVICDGQNTGKGNDLPTYQICEKLLSAKLQPYKDFKHKSWKGNTIIVKGKCGYIGNTGIPYLFLVKIKNMGKKDSLIMIRELALGFNGGRDRSLGAFGHFFCKSMAMFSVAKIDYITGTDADTVLSSQSIDLLIRKMEEDPRLIGVSGNVKIDLTVNPPWSPWTAYQYFEVIRH
jgi:cellulose synthase/poly-beta-1,6-N-acetylglucosamine synthase-like glycosyltransferase